MSVVVQTDAHEGPVPEQLWADLQQVAMRVYADFDPTEPEVRDKWESEQRAAAAA